MTTAVAIAAVPTAAFAAGPSSPAASAAASAVASAPAGTTAATTAGTTAGRVTAARPTTSTPDLGPNVLVFDPSMAQSVIQAKVDAIAAQQVPNEMGTARYALLFKPGTYGTATAPLNFQVGYYTEVAGLGQNPGDVVVNGSIYVRNQCYGRNCIALNNFWRSMSNLTINVTTPDFGCYSGEFWAVSQAAPLRRVDVKGQTTLMDYCTSPSFASGGFIADSKFEGPVINGSQQQFFVRNSTLNGWSNGVWNQVFSGTDGAPAECFPQVNGCGPYTTVATTSVSREKPYLWTDAAGGYNVFVPKAATNTSGVTWANGSTPGRSIPISEFFVASPADSAQAINRELAQGRNLLLTPGVYHLDQTIKVKRADTVVLGLGLASLTPTRGQVAMSVADVPGVDIAGITFDAGPVNSPVLLQIGTQRRGKDDHGKRGEHGDDGRDHAGKSSAANPTGLQDVFFRIGGPSLGKATVSLEINSDHVVIDDIW
ncbi:MAG: glycosyl hydrolase family 28-related protein, partial [Humibacillus sp.]